MGYKMKGSSFYGHGNQHKDSPNKIIGAVLGGLAKKAVTGLASKAVGALSGKKKEEEAPTKYKSPAKNKPDYRKSNLLKAVPNKKAYDKLSDLDKKGFDKAAKSAGFPTKKAPGKFLLTAAKVVGKGLMGRAKQKDARDASINEGVQKAMSRKL